MMCFVIFTLWLVLQEYGRLGETPDIAYYISLSFAFDLHVYVLASWAQFPSFLQLLLVHVVMFCFFLPLILEGWGRCCIAERELARERRTCCGTC
jgi:hypothetical protein